MTAFVLAKITIHKKMETFAGSNEEKEMFNQGVGRHVFRATSPPSPPPSAPPVIVLGSVVDPHQYDAVPDLVPAK